MFDNNNRVINHVIMTIDKEQRWSADMSVIDQSASVCLRDASLGAQERARGRGAVSAPRGASFSLNTELLYRWGGGWRAGVLLVTSSSISDDRSVYALSLIRWFDPGAATGGDNQRHQSINQPHPAHLMWDTARSDARAAARDNQLSGGRSGGSDAAGSGLGSGLWTGFWIMWPTSRSFDPRRRWRVSGGTCRWSR